MYPSICHIGHAYVHIVKWLNYFAGREYTVHFVPFGEAEIPAIVEAQIDQKVTVHEAIGEFHLKRIDWTVNSLWRLRRLLRRCDTKILHCHFVGANAWYAALSQFHPLVLTVMGADLRASGWEPGSIRERILTPYALRRADAITCWSRGLEKVAQRFKRPGVSTHVIHGGVDMSRFVSRRNPGEERRFEGIPEAAQIILSPRLMRPLYNIDTIVRAFSLVSGEIAETALVLIRSAYGFAAYEREISDLIEAVGVTRNTYVFDEVVNEDMPGLYRRAAVTVSIPSQDGTPMTALESMACETPVIMSDIPDYDTEMFIGGKTVEMVPPRDHYALAETIVRVLRDDDCRRRLTVNGLSVVRAEGDDRRQGQRMEDVYRGLLVDRVSGW